MRNVQKLRQECSSLTVTRNARSCYTDTIYMYELFRKLCRLHSHFYKKNTSALQLYKASKSWNELPSITCLLLQRPKRVLRAALLLLLRRCLLEAGHGSLVEGGIHGHGAEHGLLWRAHHGLLVGHLRLHAAHRRHTAHLPHHRIHLVLGSNKRS